MYLIFNNNNIESEIYYMPKGVPKSPKKCVICGKMFMPERSSTKICNKDQVIYLVISMYLFDYFSSTVQCRIHTLYNNAI